MAIDSINSVLAGRPTAAQKSGGAEGKAQTEAKLKTLKKANEVKKDSILKLINQSLGRGRNVDIKA